MNVALSLASFDVWDTFEERFGVDIAHRRVGYLFLAREESTAERLREAVTMQNERGIPSEFLDSKAARERCGDLRVSRFVGASYSPTDGFADPNLAVQGYANAIRETGVEVGTNTMVTRIRRDGKRVVGVEVDGEGIDADYMVNAAGP